MAKIIKILSETSTPQYASKFMLVSFNGEAVRFKVVAKNYNCGWNVDIYMQTKNYEFAKVACEDDIPGTDYVNYCSSEVNRIEGNEDNIDAAIKFIENVF